MTAPERSVPIRPVILSGGSGTRLWPLSRAHFPKQLLSLTGERSLLQETALRVQGDAFADPIVICGVEQRFLVAEQLRAVGVTPAVLALEPVGRGTAAAATMAALLNERAGDMGVIALLPSDHRITQVHAFRQALAVAAAAAAAGRLVAFAITPTEANTGYGYVRRGAALAGLPGTFALDRFVEKPDVARATAMVASGDYGWNSGMFVFDAQCLLAEMERLAPAILAGCQAALAGSARDLDFLRLDADAFAAVPTQPFDTAVMERTKQGAVVPADIGWSDVGSWPTLWAETPKDASGNVTLGDVVAIDAQNSYLRSEKGLLAAVGVEDLVVVSTGDVVFAAPRARAHEVAGILERLKAAGRTEVAEHQRVYRPWGYYESIDSGPTFQVKRLHLKPGARLSLQSHARRAEHWVVVEGEATVTRDSDIATFGPNQSAYIPIGMRHRLENRGPADLLVIEVQSGAYLGEDDIVRYEDVYGRAPN